MTDDTASLSDEALQGMCGYHEEERHGEIARSEKAAWRREQGIKTELAFASSMACRHSYKEHRVRKLINDVLRLPWIEISSIFRLKKLRYLLNSEQISGENWPTRSARVLIGRAA